MSLWFFVSDFEQVYSVCQVCRKIILCSFGMFEFLLRSALFWFSFEYCRFSYLGIHSYRAFSILANPAKFKQFRPIYRFFKPEKHSQTQEIRETFTKFCLKAYFQTWLCFGCVFAQIKINNIQYIYIYIHIYNI